MLSLVDLEGDTIEFSSRDIEYIRSPRSDDEKDDGPRAFDRVMKHFTNHYIEVGLKSGQTFLFPKSDYPSVVSEYLDND